MRNGTAVAVAVATATTNNNDSSILQISDQILLAFLLNGNSSFIEHTVCWYFKFYYSYHIKCRHFLDIEIKLIIVYSFNKLEFYCATVIHSSRLFFVVVVCRVICLSLLFVECISADCLWCMSTSHEWNDIIWIFDMLDKSFVFWANRKKIYHQIQTIILTASEDRIKKLQRKMM